MKEAPMEEIIKALRDLVAEMYKDLHGAYGADAYEGQYEAEIQALARAIVAHQNATPQPLDNTPTPHVPGLS